MVSDYIHPSLPYRILLSQALNLPGPPVRIPLMNTKRATFLGDEASPTSQCYKHMCPCLLPISRAPSADSDHSFTWSHSVHAMPRPSHDHQATYHTEDKCMGFHVRCGDQTQLCSYQPGDHRQGVDPLSAYLLN